MTSAAQLGLTGDDGFPCADGGAVCADAVYAVSSSRALPSPRIICDFASFRR